MGKAGIILQRKDACLGSMVKVSDYYFRALHSAFRKRDLPGSDRTRTPQPSCGSAQNQCETRIDKKGSAKTRYKADGLADQPEGFARVCKTHPEAKLLPGIPFSVRLPFRCLARCRQQR